jgi:hypothetical protein
MGNSSSDASFDNHDRSDGHLQLPLRPGPRNGGNIQSDINGHNSGNFDSFNNSYNTVTTKYYDGCTFETSDETRELLLWLSPLQPQAKHQDVRSGRLEGTGDWLLRMPKFQIWRDGSGQSVDRILCCYGDPGVGKTAIRYAKCYTMRRTVN